MKATVLSQQELLPTYPKSVYLDLICSWDNMPQRLSQAREDIMARPDVRRPPKSSSLRLTRAGDEMTRAKLDELVGGAASDFAMYRTDQTLAPTFLLSAAQALARHFASIGVRFDGPERLLVDGFGDVKLDLEGRVVSADGRAGLKGVHALALLAAFVGQDFGLVLRHESRLRYAFDCSAFEKTPKDIDTGYNHYVGLDFLEWHRRIPKLGEPLAELFELLDRAFESDSLDLFTVDLRGRNLYTNGTLVVHRYERDYVLPLRHPEGRHLGFVNFADVFMKEIAEERRPQEGGTYFDVGCPRQFHKQFPVIRHAAFRPHPTGMRPLPHAEAR